MTDDIVTRLHRHRCVTGIRTVIDDAADEIETLRAELARNADECRETLTELRQRVETIRAERDEANANAKLYRDERDEARREVCAMSFDDQRRTAEDRGWDCFKEPAHAP